MLQLPNIGNEPGADRVLMDVQHQTLEVALPIDRPRAVAILKEVTDSLVARVEIARVARAKPRHQASHRSWTRLEGEVDVVWQEGPRETPKPECGDEPLQPGGKRFTINRVVEDRASLDSAQHDVLHDTRCVSSGSARHGWLRGTGLAL